MSDRVNKGALRGVLAFTERNILEHLRSPVSWVFGLALPIAIFVIMQAIISGIGEAAAQVPMFAVSRFTGGVMLFGGSFLGLFCAMSISGDRARGFMRRLFVSTMRPAGYILGYTLAVMPIAFLQVVVTMITALCFGLPFSARVLAAAGFALIFSLLFISIGVLLGSILGEKSAPPVCSIVVQIAVLLSGMYFDLDAVGAGFGGFCRALPFACGNDVIRYTLSGEWGKVGIPFLIAVAYTVVFALCAIFAFKRRLKS